MMNIVRGLRDSLVPIKWLKENDAEKLNDLNEYNTDSDDDDENENENEDDDIDHNAICGICMDNPIYFDLSTRFKNYPSCKHYDDNYCNSCLYKYTSEQIESKKFGFIQCPYPSCSNQFKKKLIKEVVEDRTYTNYLTEKRNIREELKCRANPYYAIKKYALTIWDNLVMNFKSLERRSNETFSRRCPSCSYIIEKNGGCQHMTCCVCKHQFFWCCGMSYAYNHSNLACLVSKYWFGCVLIAGSGYLLWPLLAYFARSVMWLFTCICLKILSINPEVLDIRNEIQNILVFIINAPDIFFVFSLLKMIECLSRNYHSYGITYGGTIHKIITYIETNFDNFFGILLFTSMYLAPTHVISSTIYKLFCSVGLFIKAMDPYVSSGGNNVSSIFSVIKAIASHDITMKMLILTFCSFLFYYIACYAKVLVAANIEKMKNNRSSIVVTPSMAELTTRIPSTSRLFIIDTCPFILSDIKVYWSLKHIINNPLVSVLLIAPLCLLLKPRFVGADILGSMEACLLLWEIICFVLQFNSMKDCFEGLSSLSVSSRNRCDKVEFMLPHEPAFFILIIGSSRLLLDAIATIFFTEISLFNKSLANIIGGLLCNPTIAVSLMLTLSVYYYVTKVI